MQSLFRYVISELYNQSIDCEVRYDLLNGGCINNTAVFRFKGRSHFIKWNTNAGDLFQKEVSGLELLKKFNVVNTPEVLLSGMYEEVGFLCLEYLEKSNVKPLFWETFGLILAQLHSETNEYYGLSEDNYIGRLPQYNVRDVDWVSFFIERRLLPQIKMATDHQLINRRIVSDFEKLFLKLENLIPIEPPALLHGDLWSGNFLCVKDQEPYIFDPAVYYGHREAELAFTKLFGGFDDGFYRSYDSFFPLQPGHEKRVEIFNLYPLLVHVNLFGASYLSSIRLILKHFV